MTSKLGHVLASGMLQCALVAAGIVLSPARAEQPAAGGPQEFVSDTSGGAARTAVTGQCVRTGMPEAGAAIKGCFQAPVETAKVPPPAAAPAQAVTKPVPDVAAVPEPAYTPPAVQPVPEHDVSVVPLPPVERDNEAAAATAPEAASAESGYPEESAETQDLADTGEAGGTQGTAGPGKSAEAAGIAAADETAHTGAAAEQDTQAGAEPETASSAQPEPIPELTEAPAPAAPKESAAPSPPAAPPPAPPQPRKLRLATDTHFHFDRAQLTPAAIAILDQLVAEISGAQIGTLTITVVGYTDRIGSDAYNQKLSERRAQSVKQYLVGRRVAADRVQASGRGENDPVTTPDTCRGQKGKRLIQCLAPDRRVEIEVVGLAAAR